MARGALSEIQRRQRQLATLRVMLAGVQELLDTIAQLASARELSADEQTEAAAVAIRRQRLIDTISEAGG